MERSFRMDAQVSKRQPNFRRKRREKEREREKRENEPNNLKHGTAREQPNGKRDEESAMEEEEVEGRDRRNCL